MTRPIKMTTAGGGWNYAETGTSFYDKDAEETLRNLTTLGRDIRCDRNEIVTLQLGAALTEFFAGVFRWEALPHKPFLHPGFQTTY